jgi:ParB family chromosome partitioning protein
MTESDTRRSRAKRRFTVESLFSDTRQRAVGVGELVDAKLIALDRIVADPEQPRRTFDPDRLEELADSIRQQGILQPIVVRYEEADDLYVIVHGERRWRAAKLAQIDALPALVRDVPAELRLIHQLTENVVRDDLNAVDRAAALRQLKATLGDPPWEDVAAAVGIKRSRIFQLLGTGKLSPQAQEDIQEGRLSEKQRRALQGLPDITPAAVRELRVAERLPEPAAMRLARAFREYPISPDDDETRVRSTLHDLRRLLIADDVSQLRFQTSTLLSTTRDAVTGANADRKRLDRLIRIVAAPRFDDDRFAKELSALSRSLSRLARDKSVRSGSAMEQLRLLHGTLGALLDDDTEPV